MKAERFAGVAVCIFVLVLGGAAFAEKAGDANAAPEAFFPESAYRFETVVDGAEVAHDFIVRNKGDAPLEIRNVATG